MKPTNALSRKLLVVAAILKKDLITLWPLVALASGMFVAETLLTRMDLNFNNPFFSGLIVALPDLNLLVIGLLAIAVVLQDPARSFSHDWLTRPLQTSDLFIAKTVFLLLTTALPIFLARLTYNLFDGFSVVAAISEASIARQSFTMLATLFFFGVATMSRSVAHCFALIVSIFVLFGFFGITLDAIPIHPDALGDDRTSQGVIWIVAVPLTILFIATFGLLYWLQFRKREPQKALALFICAFALTTVIVISPFLLPSWPSIFSILRDTVSGNDSSEVASIRLDSLDACFPASNVNFNSDMALVVDSNTLIGGNHFDDEDFTNAGPGSLTFATTFSPGNVPRDWRITTLKAKSTFTTSTDNSVTLRAARRTEEQADAESNNTITNYWLIPGAARRELEAAEDLELQLDFSLSILKPKIHKIKMDGIRRFIPDLGHCRAQRKQIENQVDVDCFIHGPRPSIVSAQLEGIDSSRVDALPVHFSPAFVQLFSGARYKLTINTPSLIESDNIELLAYFPEAFVERKLTREGLLGSSAGICESQLAPLVQSQSGWQDNSPHETSFYYVEPDVRLEVLDWGGDENSEDLILITGLGASAHSFDTLAPKLAENYRVRGITRRGLGASSRPSQGYHLDQLGDDIVAILDAQQIESAILVGHSLGGDEISNVAARYPERVSGLIYLDAAYDRSNREALRYTVSNRLPPRPRPTRVEMSSFAAFSSYLERMGSLGFPQGEVMANLDFNSGQRTFDPRVMEAIMVDLPAPDYAAISAPALAIFAIPESPEDLIEAWHDPSDLSIWNAATEMFIEGEAYRREQIKQFREQMPDAEVLEIQGADHWIFISNETDVLDAINGFSLSIGVRK